MNRDVTRCNALSLTPKAKGPELVGAFRQQAMRETQYRATTGPLPPKLKR